MRHGGGNRFGILPLALASPSASSGSFVLGQDDRIKKASYGTNSPALARALIRCQLAEQVTLGRGFVSGQCTNSR